MVYISSRWDTITAKRCFHLVAVSAATTEKSTTWPSAEVKQPTAYDMWRLCQVRLSSSMVIPNDYKYLADDRMLMVWDLEPSANTTAMNVSPSPSPSPPPSPRLSPISPAERPQPTAYVIAFPYPLSSVCSHPSSSTEFLVADARGSIFVTDWRSDPEQDSWRNQSMIELVEPRAMADALCGMPGKWSGSIDWRRDSFEVYVLLSSLQMRSAVNVLVDAVGSGLHMGQGSLYGTLGSFMAESRL